MDGSPLAGWENFYVIVGSTAGGLTGLTFVVIALVKDARRVNPAALRGYVTPTIVHFGGVLALAAFLSMPHQHLLPLSAGFAVGGVAGLIYTGFIAANIYRQRIDYMPVREDWIWNVILPGLAYAALLVVAALIWCWRTPSLFAVATVSLTMLFVGVHNAWDIAVYMTTLSEPRAAKQRTPD